LVVCRGFKLFLVRSFPRVSPFSAFDSKIIGIYKKLDETMRDVLAAFDQFLEKEDLTFTATVIGATALKKIRISNRLHPAPRGSWLD